MTKVGLMKAAELTGKSASTIHRAMKAGRLSFDINEHGERVIDASELFCVFPPKASGETSDELRDDIPSTIARYDLQLAKVEVELRAAREKNAILAVTDCNRNWPGLQSSRSWDHILGIYHPAQDHIYCHWHGGPAHAWRLHRAACVALVTPGMQGTRCGINYQTIGMVDPPMLGRRRGCIAGRVPFITLERVNTG
jgi:hypothetical protein